jgi:hypothetical protein
MAGNPYLVTEAAPGLDQACDLVLGAAEDERR